MLAALKNRVTKAYFLFLSHCLKIINSLNVEFQGEGPMVQLLLPKLTLAEIRFKMLCEEGYPEFRKTNQRIILI